MSYGELHEETFFKQIDLLFVSIIVPFYTYSKKQKKW